MNIYLINVLKSISTLVRMCSRPLITKGLQMKERFSYLLRENLKNRYGKIPSAEIVARNFNIRAYGTTPVTQESVRRWIRGESLPKPEHLIVLVRWLGLNLNQIITVDLPIKTSDEKIDTNTTCNSINHHQNVCDQLIENGSCKLINEIKNKVCNS